MKFYFIFMIVIVLAIVFYSVDAVEIFDIVVSDKPIIRDEAIIIQCSSLKNIDLFWSCNFIKHKC